MKARRSLDGENHRNLRVHHRTEVLVKDILAGGSLEIGRIPAVKDSRRTDTDCKDPTCWECGWCSRLSGKKKVD